MFLPFGVGDGDGIEPWQATSHVVVAGLVVVGLGLLDDRPGRRLRPHWDSPAPVGDRPAPGLQSEA